MLSTDYDPEGFSDVVERVDRVLYLRSLMGFSTLSTEHLGFIAPLLEERWFAPGERLLEEGVPVGSIHLIVEGKVRVRRDGAAFRVFGPREAVGVFALFSGAQRGVQATAETRVRTLALESATLREIFEERFDMFVHNLQTLAALLIEERRMIPDNAGLSSTPVEALGCPSRELNLVERMFFLRRSRGFENAGVLSIAALAENVRERRVEAGELIWSEGDPAHEVGFLVNGAIAGETEGSGQHFEFGPGDLFGASDAVSGGRRWYSTRARRTSAILVIPVSVLLDVFEDHMDLGMIFLSFFASRILTAFETRAALEGLEDGPQPAGSGG